MEHFEVHSVMKIPHRLSFGTRNSVKNILAMGSNREPLSGKVLDGEALSGDVRSGDPLTGDVLSEEAPT